MKPRRRNILPVIPLIWFAFLPHSISAEESGALASPVLSAESAILIDAASGTVWFEKNADKPMYPASTTKIITAIVALETADLNGIVTVSKKARNEEGTRVYLAEGEKVTMEKLLYALMVNSGNDAATAIAEHIDGSNERFAGRMNDFVRRKVGVSGTVNKNPSGLPDPEHVTTARDMSKIALYAMRNPAFRAIVSTKKMPWNGKEWQSSLINHNQLLRTYEGATGVKNGFTQAARSTLVGSAARNGIELIGVVLKSPNKKALYEDMTRLLDYGFENAGPAAAVQRDNETQTGQRTSPALHSLRRLELLAEPASQPVQDQQQQHQQENKPSPDWKPYVLLMIWVSISDACVWFDVKRLFRH